MSSQPEPTSVHEPAVFAREGFYVITLPNGDETIAEWRLFGHGKRHVMRPHYLLCGQAEPVYVEQARERGWYCGIHIPVYRK